MGGCESCIVIVIVFFIIVIVIFFVIFCTFIASIVAGCRRVVNVILQ